MKILWVATKAPWPPIDGGRRHLLDTLRALAAAGATITLVAPIERSSGDPAMIVRELSAVCNAEMVGVRRRPLALAILRSLLARRPLTIARHAWPAVSRRVAQAVAAATYDVVIAEQAQAFWAAEAARSALLPVVLRAQNVESDLWAETARRSFWRRPLLAWEARRLAAWEGAIVRRAEQTLTLTLEDRERLAELAGDRDSIAVVPAPFPSLLPAAAGQLAGRPAIVLFGSSGWRPNREGAAWFLREVLPRLRERLPGAVVHGFGLMAPLADDVSLVTHPAPPDSRVAFAEGAVLVVPLRVASGVRIKILEAWARGVPVIATTAAARGLGATDGVELLIADTAGEFIDALCRIERLRAGLIERARERLRLFHAPSTVAGRTIALLRHLIQKERA